MVMDSKGLHDSLDNDLPGDDRKSAMEVPIILEFLRLAAGRARWTPLDRNPADALSKFRGAHLEPLIKLLTAGRYRLSPEEESLRERQEENVEKGHNSRRKTTAQNSLHDFESHRPLSACLPLASTDSLAGVPRAR